MAVKHARLWLGEVHIAFGTRSRGLRQGPFFKSAIINTFGTAKNPSRASGALSQPWLLVAIGAEPRASRFFEHPDGVTDVIGSTPSTSTSFRLLDKPRILLKLLRQAGNGGGVRP